MNAFLVFECAKGSGYWTLAFMKHNQPAVFSRLGLADDWVRKVHSKRRGSRRMDSFIAEVR